MIDADPSGGAGFLIALLLLLAWAGHTLLGRRTPKHDATPSQPARRAREREVADVAEAEETRAEAGRDLQAIADTPDLDERSERLAERARDRRGSVQIPDSCIWACIPAVLLIGAYLLAGCAPRGAPDLWEPMPALTVPSAVEWEPAPDDCPRVETMLPGRPVPYATEEGIAACRAQVVPEPRFAALLQAEDDAAYWRERAEIERRAREDDQDHASTVCGECWTEARSLRRQLGACRAAASGALVLAGVCVVAP